MNVIRFPGGRGPSDRSKVVNLAVHLKQRLISFVVAGGMRPLFVESIEDNEVEFSDEDERIEFTDWFIFEWEDVDGSTTIERFLSSNDDLATNEREMLQAWNDGSIENIFRVADLRGGFVEFGDAFGNLYRAVPTSCETDDLGFEIGDVVSTRILPVGDFYVLSGIQKRFDVDGSEILDPDVTDSETEDELAELLAEERRLTENEVDHLLEYDVRDFKEGTLGRFAREYLDRIFETLPEQDYEAEARALDALVTFNDEIGPDRPNDLRGDDILEFFALWYPRQWHDLDDGSAKLALTSILRFLRYLDTVLGTFVGTEYERDVLPQLYDLPRCVKATSILVATGQDRDTEEALDSLIDGTATDVSDIIEGIFDVSSVDASTVTLSSPPFNPEDYPGEPTAFVVQVPDAAAGLVAIGDFVECIVVEIAGTWSLAGVRGVYPSAARAFLSRAEPG